MSKFKFNIDPKDPQEDQIARHKNFGKVMQNYQHMTSPLYKKPLYRHRKLFLLIVLILLVAWLVSEYGEDNIKQHIIPTDSIQRTNN